MSVVSIHIAPERGGATVTLEAAKLIAGRGIEGDHHWAQADGPAEAQVTLIQAEHVEAFNAETNGNIEAAETRRNVVTRGVELTPLIGQRFTLGEAELEGLEPCDPCANLGRRLQTPAFSPAAIVKALMGRGGLRARVVRGGMVAAGDEVRVGGAKPDHAAQ